MIEFSFLGESSL